LTPYFNANNHFGNKTNIYGRATSFNMLCLHKSKTYDIGETNKITDARFHPLREMSK
jgi:hypothetical protein